MKKNNTK